MAVGGRRRRGFRGTIGRPASGANSQRRRPRAARAWAAVPGAAAERGDLPRGRLAHGDMQLRVWLLSIAQQSHNAFIGAGGAERRGGRHAGNGAAERLRAVRQQRLPRKKRRRHRRERCEQEEAPAFEREPDQEAEPIRIPARPIRSGRPMPQHSATVSSTSSACRYPHRAPPETHRRCAVPLPSAASGTPLPR